MRPGPQYGRVEGLLSEESLIVRGLQYLSLRPAVSERSVKIQINTDHSVKVHESESVQVLQIVEGALSRFEEHITRVEMHLSDENASKGGPNDKRCLLEARLKGRKPQAVSHLAGSLILAVEGAADKLARSIESDIGRRAAIRHQHVDSLPGDAEVQDD